MVIRIVFSLITGGGSSTGGWAIAKSGKFKVYFSDGTKSEANDKLALRFKKYVFEHDAQAKKMQQTGL